MGTVAVILYCRLCSTGYGSAGELPPKFCPTCKRETKWGPSPPTAQQPPGWRPSENDRRMLRAFKIDPE
jgi:hypothetical protein